MSGELLYHPGSVGLSPSGQAALSKVAPQLATMAAQNNEINVIGNTDDVSIGRELAERHPSNWEMAGARAAVVVRYLQEKGVGPTSSGQFPRGSIIRSIPTTLPSTGSTIAKPICSCGPTRECKEA